ncbi:tartronate semialdehyde reductase [Paenibacillus swuensis]|uniref:Tartronate semialdehyde reductase n=1 Tax=Paenibacillus swuensis TaxID=1178515 RepID=A0A172TH12_9BACL|nr:tartronate semialdehyde reductase [Paenibacillus swuensis]
MKTIGFIGLGTMGKPMAANLIKKGYAVIVYNRTMDKAAELVELGAETAANPSEIAKLSDVIITMVSNDASLEQVIFGPEGIIHGIRSGTAVIDCSTVSPTLSRRIASELGEHFVGFLDAPVTGSKPAAIDGTLLFMVGGDNAVLDAQQDVFGTLGSRIIHMGPSGSGSYAKLAHNTIVGINNAAFAEGMMLAAQAGLDPEKFLQVVRLGSAGSKAAELKGNKIIERDFSTQFSLALMLKDLKLAASLTNELRMPSPLLDSAKNLFQMADSKGYSEDDLCSVVRVYEEWTNNEIQTIQTATNPTTQDAETAAELAPERRRSSRLQLNIQLQISVYQWEQEGAFKGQTIEGTLVDLSNSGLQILSSFPLAEDMFIVIHFPKEADLPPVTGKIIRADHQEDQFRYGCMLTGLPPHTRLKLEYYIERQLSL